MRMVGMLAGVLVGLAAMMPPAAAQEPESQVSMAELDALGRAAVLTIFPNPAREGRRMSVVAVVPPSVGSIPIPAPRTPTRAPPAQPPAAQPPAAQPPVAQPPVAQPRAAVPVKPAAAPPVPASKPEQTRPNTTQVPLPKPELPKPELPKAVPVASGGVLRVGPVVADRVGGEEAKAAPAKVEPPRVEEAPAAPAPATAGATASAPAPATASAPAPATAGAVSGASGPSGASIPANWRDVARIGHRYAVEGVPDLFSRLNANPTQKRLFDLTPLNFTDTIALSGKKVAASQLAGDWYCRSIKVVRDAAFGFPYFNCRITRRDGRLYFEKTSGTQRRAGWLFEDEGKRWVFLGALAYGEDTPMAYSGLPGGGDPSMDLVGVVVAGNAGQILAIFPESDAYELYELVK